MKEGKNFVLLALAIILVLGKCASTQQQKNQQQSQIIQQTNSNTQGQEANNQYSQNASESNLESSQMTSQGDILDGDFSAQSASDSEPLQNFPALNNSKINSTEGVTQLNQSLNGSAIPLESNLNPPITPNQAQDISDSTTNSRQAPLTTESVPTIRNRNTPFAIMDWIGYEIKDDKLVIEMGFNGRPTHEIREEINKARQREIIVRLYNTELRPRIRREINASEFYSPVSYIRPRMNKGENFVDIILTMRDVVQPEFHAKGSLFTLKFPVSEKFRSGELPPPVVVEKAQVLSEKPQPTPFVQPPASPYVAAPEATQTQGREENSVQTPERTTENQPQSPTINTPAENIERDVQITGKELPSPLKPKDVPAKKSAVIVPQGQTLPAAPAQPQAVPYIPPAPELQPPVQLQNPPPAPASPRRVDPRQFKNEKIEDGGFEEDDKAGGDDEKFEVRLRYRVGAVAQANFNSQGSLPNATLTGDNSSNSAANSLGSTNFSTSEDTGEDTLLFGEGANTPVAPVQGEPVVQGGEILGQNVGESQAAPAQKRAIKVDFRGAPLSEVIRVITSESKTNFIIPNDIGKIPVSLNLTDVPWDLALKIILETNNLGMSQLGPNIIRIDALKKFAEDKRVEEDAKKSVEKLVPTKVLVMRLSYSKAASAMTTINNFLETVRKDDPRTRVQADERTNSLIVEGTPSVLAKVKALMERIDLQTPQVRIASRIMEVTKSFTKEFGIAWGAPFFVDQGRGLGFGALPFPRDMRSAVAVDPELDKVGGSGQAAFKFGSISNSFALDVKLRAEEIKGNGETLKNQSVIVQDNEQATIAAGTREGYQITGTQTTPGSIYFVDYQLEMKVTPRITSDGAVQMKLDVTSNSPVDATSATAIGQQTRSVSTMLIRKNGETAVIGGLYATDKQKGMTGIPLLMDLPIVGALFRKSRERQNQRELIVMVTPTILNAANSYSNPSSAPMDAVSPEPPSVSNFSSQSATTNINSAQNQGINGNSASSQSNSSQNQINSLNLQQGEE